MQEIEKNMNILMHSTCELGFVIVCFNVFQSVIAVMRLPQLITADRECSILMKPLNT